MVSLTTKDRVISHFHERAIGWRKATETRGPYTYTVATGLMEKDGVVLDDGSPEWEVILAQHVRRPVENPFASPNQSKMSWQARKEEADLGADYQRYMADDRK